MKKKLKLAKTGKTFTAFHPELGEIKVPVKHKNDFQNAIDNNDEDSIHQILQMAQQPYNAMYDKSQEIPINDRNSNIPGVEEQEFMKNGGGLNSIHAPYVYSYEHGGYIPIAQDGISFMNPQTQWNPNLGVGNFNPQMPIEGDPMITEQGRQQQYPIKMNRMEQNSISSINPNQTPIQQNNFGLGKSPSKVKSKGVKSTFKGQNPMAPVIPNMFSANPYLAKANFYRNQAIQDFAGIQGNGKQQSGSNQYTGMMDESQWSPQENAPTQMDNMQPINLNNANDMHYNWGTGNSQFTGSKYGGLIHAQNGMNIGAGISSAVLADINTAKGFGKIAGGVYQNQVVAGIENQQRRANLVGQSENTIPQMGDGWGGMQPLEGAYVPIGKYGGTMQDGGDMQNGIPSKFTGARHYEGGIPVNTDVNSSNANDMKTHRDDANLEVEGGEYMIPGMQNGGKQKSDVILSDRKNIGWNGKSPSENYEELTKAELGISADKFNKGITKSEKFLADNIKFVDPIYGEKTQEVVQKLSVPIKDKMQELAQNVYKQQELTKYNKGMNNDLDSIMQSNQQPMAQYGAQIPDDMNYYDTGKMFMANGGSLPMAQNGIIVSDKNNTYIKNNGKWYYYNDKKVGAEVPAKANIMTKEGWVKGGKGFNESFGGKSLDKLYSSLNKTNSTTSSASSTPITNPYAPYSINQTSQGNAKTETGQYITSPPIQTANWNDVIFPSVEKNHPELKSNLIPGDPTRANALLQENMYDDALDRIQGIGAYEGATLQDKEAALAEFKRMWGQHGRVRFNNPGQYPDALKNMSNWKVGDANTLNELNSLRGNFIDNKLERRYLLSPQGTPPVVPPKQEKAGDKYTPINADTALKGKKPFDFNAINASMYIPNEYAAKPITSYDVNPQFAQPHVISPYVNDIQRLQFQNSTNLGGSGAELATRANMFGQGLQEYGKRYYDAAVYNAGAKTQADNQNVNAAYTSAVGNRANQWQTESAQNQRDAAIQGQKMYDQNSYLSAMADREHEGRMIGAAHDIYNPDYVNWQNYASANLNNKPTVDETTYKIDKFGNYVPTSAKNKKQFGGKVNKLNTKKFKKKK